jgi:hypothetical protein
MRRPAKFDLRESAIASGKGITAATAVFAVVAFSPLLEWSGYPRSSWPKAIAVTLEFFVATVVGIAATEFLKWWFEPKS